MRGSGEYAPLPHYFQTEMRKIYKAYTGLSIRVRKAGASRSTLVSFREQAAGGSLFDTDDKVLQEAIEKHPEYGKGFVVRDVILTDEEREEVKAEKKKPAADAAGTVAEKGAAAETETEATEMKVHAVADEEEAKRVLMEVYHISATKCNTPSKIKKVAEKLGVEFVQKNAE